MSVPLLNKKILITREQHQAESFAELIEQQGGIPIIVPLIEIACLDSKEKSLPWNEYEWIFFTSVNGVRCFMKQIDEKDKVRHCRIAAVGRKTASAVEQYGLSVNFTPKTYNAETMVTEFTDRYPDSDNILLVRGNLSLNVLPEAFKRRNVLFDSVIVYETKPNVSIKNKLISTIENNGIDIITFTSPSTVNTFVSLLEDTTLINEVRHVPIVSIGTTTEQAAIHHQFKTLITPSIFTIEAMIVELEKYLIDN